MDVFNLAAQLRDPDPRIRVSTLRILAMLEETRALKAVAWVYKNDPEGGVREVANWAGRILYAAQQRGHSTQVAMEAFFSQSATPELRARFLQEMESRIDEVARKGPRRAAGFANEQNYRRQIDEVLRVSEADQPPLLGDGQALDEARDASQSASHPSSEPNPETSGRHAASGPSSVDDDEVSLLDAGLSDLFRE